MINFSVIIVKINDKEIVNHMLNAMNLIQDISTNIRICLAESKLIFSSEKDSGQLTRICYNLNIDALNPKVEITRDRNQGFFLSHTAKSIFKNFNFFAKNTCEDFFQFKVINSEIFLSDDSIDIQIVLGPDTSNILILKNLESNHILKIKYASYINLCDNDQGRILLNRKSLEFKTFAKKGISILFNGFEVISPGFDNLLKKLTSTVINLNETNVAVQLKHEKIYSKFFQHVKDFDGSVYINCVYENNPKMESYQTTYIFLTENGQITEEFIGLTNFEFGYENYEEDKVKNLLEIAEANSSFIDSILVQEQVSISSNRLPNNGVKPLSIPEESNKYIEKSENILEEEEFQLISHNERMFPTISAYPVTSPCLPITQSKKEKKEKKEDNQINEKKEAHIFL